MPDVTFWSTNWGDVTGLFGIFLSAIAAYAANRARQAAQKVAKRIEQLNTVTDLNSLITNAQRVRSIHYRRDMRAVLSHEYNIMKRNLIDLINRSVMDEEEIRSIRDLIITFSALEREVMNAKSSEITEMMAQAERRFATQVDILSEIYSKLQFKLRENSHDP